MKNIEQKISKLEALAAQGEPHEAENAKSKIAILQARLKKTDALTLLNQLNQVFYAVQL